MLKRNVIVKIRVTPASRRGALTRNRSVVVTAAAAGAASRTQHLHVGGDDFRRIMRRPVLVIGTGTQAPFNVNWGTLAQVLRSDLRQTPVESDAMPLGAFLLLALGGTASAATFTVTPFGIGIGFLPIRDMTFHHTLQRTSPPTPALRAARPVITPREVVRMLVPSPPTTAGPSSTPR